MSRSVVVTANLEDGRPVVRDALMRLDAEITAAKARGARCLRLIHGYGSSGKGGRIRAAVRKRLVELQSQGRIRAWLPGEDYSDLTVRGQEMLQAAPTLRSSLRSDADNPGISIVLV